MKHKFDSAKQKLAPHKDKFMYLGVGILAFIVDAGMFTVVRKLGASIGIANIMGMVSGITSRQPAMIPGMVSGMITSFSLNWQVVFKNKKYRRQFHHMIGIFLALNIFNWWFSTNFIRLIAPVIVSLAESIINLSLGLSASEFLAKVGSIAVIICWNFILYKKVIFKEA